MRRFATTLLMGVLAMPLTTRGQTAVMTTPLPGSAIAPDGQALPANPAFMATYGAPGRFGMAYGSPSYGLTATYSVFSSPYGPGYGYGYGPAALLPGRYGVGLWRPGFVAPGYIYGAGFYRTFPVPFQPVDGGPVPPVGAYAPHLGPPPGGVYR